MRFSETYNITKHNKQTQQTITIYIISQTISFEKEIPSWGSQAGNISQTSCPIFLSPLSARGRGGGQWVLRAPPCILEPLFLQHKALPLGSDIYIYIYICYDYADMPLPRWALLILSPLGACGRGGWQCVPRAPLCILEPLFL